MKNVIATTALILSLSAPAFADVSSAQSYLLAFNESSREQNVDVTAEVPTRGPKSSAIIAAKEALAHEDSRDGRIFIGGNASTGAGNAQLAAQLGVNADDFSTNELIAMIVRLENDGS